MKDTIAAPPCSGKLHGNLAGGNYGCIDGRYTSAKFAEQNFPTNTFLKIHTLQKVNTQSATDQWLGKTI